MKKLLCVIAVMLAAAPASAGVIDFASIIDTSFGEQAVEDGRVITYGDLKITFRAANVILGPPLVAESLYSPTDFNYTVADMSTTNATFAYFDQGNAGVGVTGKINNTDDSNLGAGKKTDRQASNGADDNVAAAVGASGRQVLVLEFAATDATDNRDLLISGLTFKDTDHNTNFGDAVLDIGLENDLGNGTDWDDYSLDSLTTGADPNLTVEQGTRMGFAYAYDSGFTATAKQHQFYLSTITYQFVPDGGEGVVPEPATLACFLPLLGFAFARRRRKNA